MRVVESLLSLLTVPAEKGFYSCMLFRMEAVWFRDFFPGVLILQFVLLLKDNNCWVDLFTKPDLQVCVNHCTMNRKEEKKISIRTKFRCLLLLLYRNLKLLYNRNLNSMLKVMC